MGGKKKDAFLNKAVIRQMIFVQPRAAFEIEHHVHFTIFLAVDFGIGVQIYNNEDCSTNGFGRECHRYLLVLAVNPVQG
jgi:hypothetical protein